MRHKALLFVGALLLFAGSIHEAPAQSPPKSCNGMQSLCAARCKVRVPDDKNCVADHCTPKLQECRQSGCWQEGNLYGGQKTCSLTKK